MDSYVFVNSSSLMFSDIKLNERVKWSFSNVLKEISIRVDRRLGGRYECA